MNYTSVQEALKAVKSGDRVYVHAAAATPTFSPSIPARSNTFGSMT